MTIQIVLLIAEGYQLEVTCSIWRWRMMKKSGRREEVGMKVVQRRSAMARACNTKEIVIRSAHTGRHEGEGRGTYVPRPQPGWLVATDHSLGSLPNALQRHLFQSRINIFVILFQMSKKLKSASSRAASQESYYHIIIQLYINIFKLLL